MSKQKLLFVTTELPWPADSGGKIKTFRLLQFLALHYDVRLLCAQGQGMDEALKELPKHTAIKSVQAFNNHRPRNVINWLEALMRFPTFNAFRVYSKAFESMLKWGVDAADVVLVDHLEMLEMIDVKKLNKVAFHSHNAEFLLWKRYAEMNGNLISKAAALLESSRIFAFERWAIKATNITFAAPNDQQAWLEQMDLPAGKLKHTFHLGDESLLELTPPNVAQNYPTVIFAGTLSWMPNVDGVRWLLRSVWPSVVQQVPDAQLHICGKGAPQSLVSEIRQCKGVEFKGFVEDLGAAMNECSAAVVPLRIGSGMKIKTLDAMYRGLPLVTTPVGCEGLELVHDQHAVIAESPAAFADGIVGILKDRSKAQSMADQGRKLAAERYTYGAVFESMLRDLQAAFPKD